jgi:hypothetical protein
LVAVEQAAGDGGVTGIGDLGVDAAATSRLIGQRRRGTCDGDNRGAGVGESGGDAPAETAASTDDDRRHLRQIARGGHGSVLLFRS